MDEAQRAARTKAIAGRIMSSIPDSDLETDIGLIVAAIGIVAGTLAAVTGSPAKFMDQLNQCAQGVIDGSLVTENEQE